MVRDSLLIAAFGVVAGGLVWWQRQYNQEAAAEGFSESITTVHNSKQTSEDKTEASHNLTKGASSAKAGAPENNQQYVAQVNQCMQMMDSEIARIDSQMLRVVSQKLRKTLYLQITLQRIHWLGHLSIITAAWNYLYASSDAAESVRCPEITTMDALAVLDPHNDGNIPVYLKGNETLIRWFSKLNSTYGTLGQASICWKIQGRNMTLERSLEQMEAEFIEGLDSGDVVYVYNTPRRLGIIVGYEQVQDGSINLLVITHEQEQKGLFRVRTSDLFVALSRRDSDFNIYQPDRGLQRLDGPQPKERTDCIIAFRGFKNTPLAA